MRWHNTSAICLPGTEEAAVTDRDSASVKHFKPEKKDGRFPS